jgi:hypothetical protein
MGKYAVIYSGFPSVNADRAAVTAAWKRWFEGLGDAVLDAGNPFAAGRSVAEDGSVSEGATHELTARPITGVRSGRSANVLLEDVLCSELKGVSGPLP